MLSDVNNLETETILLGDININHLKKTEHHREIKDLIVAQGFKQLFESPPELQQNQTL